MSAGFDDSATLVLERSRSADFLTLTKPELTLLSVLTALGGAFLGLNGSGQQPLILLHVLLGTVLVGGGAGALNQYIERRYDAMMKRTEKRPLPAGRLSPTEGLLFGGLLSAGGLVYLFITTNVLTASLACVTLSSYLFLYTPLKRLTWFSTIIGGVPGALPPVMGWTAVRNEISMEAVVLFALLFFWQMPHFFSLAWMYRKDYDRAGFPLLPVLDKTGMKTGRQVVLHTIALVLTSVSLAPVAQLGVVYICGAVVLGMLFLSTGVRLFRDRSTLSARHVFFASLAYLPLLLAVVVVDRL